MDGLVMEAAGENGADKDEFWASLGRDTGRIPEVIRFALEYTEFVNGALGDLEDADVNEIEEDIRRVPISSVPTVLRERKLLKLIAKCIKTRGFNHYMKQKRPKPSKIDQDRQMTPEPEELYNKIMRYYKNRLVGSPEQTSVLNTLSTMKIEVCDQERVAKIVCPFNHPAPHTIRCHQDKSQGMKFSNFVAHLKTVHKIGSPVSSPPDLDPYAHNRSAMNVANIQVKPLRPVLRSIQNTTPPRNAGHNSSKDQSPELAEHVMSRNRSCSVVHKITHESPRSNAKKVEVSDTANDDSFEFDTEFLEDQSPKAAEHVMSRNRSCPVVRKITHESPRSNAKKVKLSDTAIDDSFEFDTEFLEEVDEELEEMLLADPSTVLNNLQGEGDPLSNVSGTSKTLDDSKDTEDLKSN
nr:uncharacterized protein LOC115256390 isoform X3 [Aedes albopictus]